MEATHVLADPAKVVEACRRRRPALAREIAFADQADPVAETHGRLKMRLLDALEARCQGAPAPVALSQDEQTALDWERGTAAAPQSASGSRG
ncbi:MAG: hypothetical protein Kow00114_36400 [Kiloniellaceae bacterium]